MSLGVNRDYKSNDRRVRHNLGAHAERMKELIAQGMSVEDASRQALQDILHPVQSYEESARTAIANKQRETDFVAGVPASQKSAARKAYRKIKKELL